MSPGHFLVTTANRPFRFHRPQSLRRGITPAESRRRQPWPWRSRNSRRARSASSRRIVLGLAIDGRRDFRAGGRFRFAVAILARSSRSRNCSTRTTFADVDTDVLSADAILNPVLMRRQTLPLLPPRQPSPPAANSCTAVCALPELPFKEARRGRPMPRPQRLRGGDGHDGRARRLPQAIAGSLLPLSASADAVAGTNISRRRHRRRCCRCRHGAGATA